MTQTLSTLKPLHGLIVVRKDEKTETAGGIQLTKLEYFDYGTVIATGKGEYQADGTFKEVTLKPGDRIIIAPGSGVVLNVKDENLLFITQNDIEGIIHDV